MLPGETLLFRLVICVVLAADTAARFEGQDYLDNRDHGNQVVGKPIDNRREEQLNGHVWLTYKVREELDGLHLPKGVGELAVNSPNVGRLTLVQPRAGVVLRPPVELHEKRQQPWSVEQQQARQRQTTARRSDFTCEFFMHLFDKVTGWHLSLVNTPSV